MLSWVEREKSFITSGPEIKNKVLEVFKLVWLARKKKEISDCTCMTGIIHTSCFEGEGPVKNV